MWSQWHESTLVNDCAISASCEKPTLKLGMIEAGTSMKQQQCWDLLHSYAGWTQFRSFEVEEEFDVPNLSAHATFSALVITTHAKPTRQTGVSGKFAPSQFEFPFARS
jgi:hypothetical protein